MPSHIGIYHVEEIRACEQHALDRLRLTENALMLRAGTSALATLRTHFPHVRNIAVFCGCGKNAGDGYVLARLALEEGYHVVVYVCKPVNELASSSQQAATAAIDAGVPCYSEVDIIDSKVELIVDALLGTGLKGEVQGLIAHRIQLMNASKIPVFSLDIPSGLNANTGQVRGCCVYATTTLTFIGLKLGLFTAEGPDHCGEIYCDDLQLDSCLTQTKPSASLLNKESLKQMPLQPRVKNCHKGHFGHVLIIGGGHGMPGSAYLSAQAALRVGAGLVSLATKPEHAGRVLPLLPEAMVYGIEEEGDLYPLLAKATVCVIGPGLGNDAWAKLLFTKAITSQIPLIIDASAIHLLAEKPQYNTQWIITPHPGEAASLLHCSTETVQADRYRAVVEIQRQYGGNILLKGIGTVIYTENQDTYLCGAGNPGMASAGMGDVLSGVIAGLYAQGMTLAEAATFGPLVHATAADKAVVASGERGLLASDLMPFLRQIVNFKE